MSGAAHEMGKMNTETKLSHAKAQSEKNTVLISKLLGINSESAKFYESDFPLITQAVIATRHTLKILHQNAPTETITRLQDEFNNPDEPNCDALDLVQEAITALLTIDGEDAFKRACSAVRNYIYSGNKQTQKTMNTQLYCDLLKIRKILKRHSINVSQVEKLRLLKIIDEKNITTSNIEKLIADEKEENKKSYTAKEISITDYELTSGEMADNKCELTELIENSGRELLQKDAIHKISKNLTAAQKSVFDLNAHGLADVEIAKELRISKSGVSQHLKNIKKVALALYPEGINQFI